MVVLAAVLIAVFPAVNLLLYHEYSWRTPESVLLLLLLGLSAALIGVAQLFHPLIKVVLSALLVTLAFVLQLDLGGIDTLILFLLMLVVGYLARDNWSALLGVVFGSMIVAGLITGSGNEVEYPAVRPVDSSLPIYLHLLVDGHMGIEGIPEDIEGGLELRRDLRAFFDSHGFVTVEKAYSRYVSTANSLRNLYQFTASDRDYLEKGPAGEIVSQRLESVAYFKILHEQGYALRIVHPRYIDYCGMNTEWISSCYSYPSQNLKSIEDAPLGAIEKLLLMLQVLVRQSSLLTGQYELRREDLGLPQLRTDLLPGSNRFQVSHLIDDLQLHGSGYAHIVHLLSPHPPFVRDSNCAYQPQRTLAQARSRDTELKASKVGERIVVTQALNTPVSRALRYKNYFATVRCNLQWLQQIMDSLKQSGQFQDAVIIVHSDHGSGIARLVPVAQWKDQLQPSDYRDNYSALYAVKGVMLEQPDAFRSLEVLLAETVRGLFELPVEPEFSEQFVYFINGQGNGSMLKVDQETYLGPLPDSAERPPEN
jgi:hypothetical protein